MCPSRTPPATPIAVCAAPARKPPARPGAPWRHFPPRIGVASATVSFPRAEQPAEQSLRSPAALQPLLQLLDALVSVVQRLLLGDDRLRHVVRRLGLDSDLRVDEGICAAVARPGALGDARDPLEEPLDRRTISLIHLILLSPPLPPKVGALPTWIKQRPDNQLSYSVWSTPVAVSSPPLGADECQAGFRRAPGRRSRVGPGRRSGRRSCRRWRARGGRAASR